MIDFFASATIALIVVMTIVIYFSNWQQAHTLKKMRTVLESWYQAKMRDRRESFRRKFIVVEGMTWLSEQADLHVIEKGRELENIRAVEFFTTDGVRLVVSPLGRRKLKTELRASEGRRRKVANLVEPMLGYRPRKVQVLERSNKTVHEWFDLEIKAELAELNLNWGDLDCLYFYVVPRVPEVKRFPRVQIVLEKILHWIRGKAKESIVWFKQWLPKVSG